MDDIEHDGKVDENDLGKLFSDDSDIPNDIILYYCQRQKLLKAMKLEYASRRDLLFEHGIMKSTDRDARIRASWRRKTCAQ